MGGSSFFAAIQIIWAVVTVVFVGLLAFRRLIGSKEEDQLFLEPAESRIEVEQKRIVSRLNRVTPYTKGFGFACLALSFIVLGFWAYDAYKAFTNPPLP